jgi:hypothetical protein
MRRWSPLVVLTFLVLGCEAKAPPPRPVPVPPATHEDGLALGIVFDTSGSMNESVADGSGGLKSKVSVATRALEMIATRVEAWRAEAPGDPKRRIAAAAVTFREGSGLPMGPFDAGAMVKWVRGLESPRGTTPLGAALRDAGEAVLCSPLRTKHVLVITDGQNTDPPEPAEVLDGLNALATRFGSELTVHFVAFDVDAKVFDAVKAKGATVAGAADAKQLDQQLTVILEEDILLEK